MRDGAEDHQPLDQDARGRGLENEDCRQGRDRNQAAKNHEEHMFPGHRFTILPARPAPRSPRHTPDLLATGPRARRAASLAERRRPSSGRAPSAFHSGNTLPRADAWRLHTMPDGGRSRSFSPRRRTAARHRSRGGGDPAPRSHPPPFPASPLASATAQDAPTRRMTIPPLQRQEAERTCAKTASSFSRHRRCRRVLDASPPPRHSRPNRPLRLYPDLRSPQRAEWPAEGGPPPRLIFGPRRRTSHRRRDNPYYSYAGSREYTRGGSQQALVLLPAGRDPRGTPTEAAPAPGSTDGAPAPFP